MLFSENARQRNSSARRTASRPEYILNVVAPHTIARDLARYYTSGPLFNLQQSKLTLIMGFGLAITKVHLRRVHNQGSAVIDARGDMYDGNSLVACHGVKKGKPRDGKTGLKLRH